jgi:plasmid stabilization system protein ParE
MTVRVLKIARADLTAGYWFYEQQEPGLGDYFLRRIYEDLELLGRSAGIHRKTASGFHKMIARRFPYAIFYRINGDTAEVLAILDGRRSPEWIRQQLKR